MSKIKFIRFMKIYEYNTKRNEEIIKKAKEQQKKEQ